MFFKRLNQLQMLATNNVTPVGWMCACIALSSLVFSLILGWTFMAAAAIFSFIVITLALPFMLGKNNYEVELEIQHLQVVVGEDVPGKIKVTNVGAKGSLGTRLEIPMINNEDQSVCATSVILRVPYLRANASFESEFILPTDRRTVFEVGPAVGVKSDPLRVFKVQKPYGFKARLFVHPLTIQIPSSQAGMIKDIDGDAIDKISMRDLTFHDIREYRLGDPISSIDWKATARNVDPTVDFLIRQFEESRRAKIVFTLSTQSDDYYTDDEFELAISAMASLGAKAAYDHRDIEIVSSETPQHYLGHIANRSNLDIQIDGSSDPRGVLDAFSSVMKSPKDMTLIQVCQRIADRIHDISLVVMGVGSTLSIDNIRRAANCLSDNCSLVVIIANPRNRPYCRRVGNIILCSLSVLEDLQAYATRKVFD